MGRFYCVENASVLLALMLRRGVGLRSMLPRLSEVRHADALTAGHRRGFMRCTPGAWDQHECHSTPFIVRGLCAQEGQLATPPPSFFILPG